MIVTGRVRSVGKNLAYNDFKTGKYYLQTTGLLGTYSAGNSTSYSESYIPITPNTHYTLSRDGAKMPSWAEMVIYDENKNITKVFHQHGNSTFLTPETAVYARVSYFSSLTDRIQLEKSTTVTPYEPHKETNLYLTAPELRSNGLVKDEIRKGANGYELVKRISDVDGSVLDNPVITPISYGGILNSAESGTVYHEPIIADAGVYGTKMDILMTDYPISAIGEISKFEDGVGTYLGVATAVIASDGLSFTHPDLVSGDLVLFTYEYDRESIGRAMTLTHFDSRYVVKDTANANVYRITPTITNGVLTWTLTLV